MQSPPIRNRATARWRSSLPNQCCFERIPSLDRESPEAMKCARDASAPTPLGRTHTVWWEHGEALPRVHARDIAARRPDLPNNAAKSPSIGRPAANWPNSLFWSPDWRTFLPTSEISQTGRHGCDKPIFPRVRAPQSLSSRRSEISNARVRAASACGSDVIVYSMERPSAA